MAISLVVFAFIMAMLFGINHLTWPREQATIERLRIDSSRVSAKMAEDVAGQVSVWNQEIAVNQRWRRTIWFFLIPSGWDDIKPIEMPTVDQ